MKKNKTKKSLVQKAKKFNKDLLKTAHDKVEYLIGPTLLLGLVSLAMAGYLALTSNGNFNLPKDTQSFANTSVRIMNLEMNSGGSGVILKSTPTMSTILTNKHVCKLIEVGGVVEHKNRTMLIRDYQKYKFHDLCLIRVMEDLKVNTKVATNAPDLYSTAFISGHPALLPHVLTSASFSDKSQIQLVTAIRACTPEDAGSIECVLFGAMPIVESFNTQLVTGTILPGSSGSGVFNAKGEISGLVFAGNGRGFSYAFIVPQEYVRDFVNTALDKDFKMASVSTNKYEIYESIFNKRASVVCAIKNIVNRKVKNICSMVETDIIWEK